MKSSAPDSSRSQFWSHHVELWKRSNLSMAAYCRKEHLTYQAFVRWEKRLPSEGVKPRFLELVPQGSASSTQARSGGAFVDLGTGVRVDLGHLSIADLAALIIALREKTA